MLGLLSPGFALAPSLDDQGGPPLSCLYSLECCPLAQFSLTISHGGAVTALTAKFVGCQNAASKTVPSSSSAPLSACIDCCDGEVWYWKKVTGTPAVDWGSANACNDVTVTCTNC
jgi:hypothetical protein